ncbi:PilN domain-containing protein [uncultured Clostridium sp.]|uniref:PilN domain-containing protein n=1 Tax=uncultured Clostridium sp. TaxID=59620 RepID=UPI0025F43C45|nr:PilN domain-containing protein [uncultured Clostridium sp.]
MQNCLGIYIENNLIKYAKVSKDRDTFKVDAFGIRFFDNLNDAIKKIVEETYSFNTQISINLANERYLYYDIFALLSKNDIQKTVETEFQTFCDENKYNQKAFETRYALVSNIQNKERIKAIQVIVNKIELNKQKQYLESHNLSGILPIGTAIASITRFEKKENVLIVNMEEKTTITTIYDRQIYNVETIDNGSQEVLEKINRTENSMSKAYEICKETTIYTANVIDDSKEQPHLEDIVPTLYQISQKVKEIVEESPVKISTVYLTGTLSVINNVDLYFQEFLPTSDCKILKPSIIESTATQINIKDYIEVNSAISLAMQSLGEGMQSLNFRKPNFMDQIKQVLNTDISLGNKKEKKVESGKEKDSKSTKKLPKISIDNVSLKGQLDQTETILLRVAIAIVLINIIFIAFSKTLYSQMDKKQEEVELSIASENAQVAKIDTYIDSLTSKDKKYTALTEELKAINDKISNIAEMKNSIPNLLNQIMYTIPEGVQLTSIQNTTGKQIAIIAQASDYDQLGYFIAKIKVSGILNNAVSSSSQKSGDVVTVKIEGELP